MPNREELAWAAGFFDGEGCVGIVRAHEKFERLPFVTVSITQAHREVLDRFRAAVGVGTVHGPYKPRKPGYLPRYSYRAGHLPQTQAICAMLWTWLGTLKREQFKQSLTRVSFRRQTQCPHGRWPIFSCPDCVRAYNTTKMREYRKRKLAATVV